MAEQFSNAPAPSREEFEDLAEQIVTVNSKIPIGYGTVVTDVGRNGQYPIPTNGILIIKVPANAVCTIWCQTYGWGLVESNSSINQSNFILPVHKGEGWSLTRSSGDATMDFVPYT